MEQLKWFRFDQNNSGGYFIQNDTICEEVFIQAENADKAIEKAQILFDQHSEYCECCGERWSYCVDDQDGTSEPMIYEVPVSQAKATWCRKQAKLHYFDDRVETVVFAI